ncbi:MAG TPA: hypothetical protein DCL01_07745 [Thauera sp.]|nr:hypothetical protein [Thauera sp.]
MYKRQLLRLIDEVVRELQPGTARRASLDSVLDRELGLDSLSRVELLARIERRFALRLPTEVLAGAETPRELLRAMTQAARAHASPRTPDRATATEPAAPHATRHDADAHAAAADGATCPAPPPLQSPAPATDGAPPALPDSAATLVEVLEWHLARHPERTHVRFLVDDEEAETLGYGQLHESAMRFAGALAARGVRPGDCVALLTRPLNTLTAQHMQRPGARSRTGHARGAMRCGP